MTLVSSNLTFALKVEKMDFGKLTLFVIIVYTFKPSSASPSVIIVGTGPSGIAAATKLLENSITNITILEAEDRIGGRINSVKFGEGIVDLGAQYCHGEKGNIAYKLAEDLEILEPGLRGLQNNVYYSNGSRLSDEFIKEIQEIYVSYDSVKKTGYNLTGRSLGEMITHKYNTALITKYENNEEKLRILKEGLRFLEGYILIHEGSFSWFDPSAECDYTKCEGNQALIWKKMGYNAILEIMMKTYPNPNEKLAIEEKIRFNTKVEKMIYNKNKSVEVVTSNGNYFANYVIFTPSIGVLKHKHKTLFNPILPLLKQEAIEATGFGGVIKIFFKFSTKWWKDEDQAFSFFWNSDSLKTKFPIWITQFRYIFKVPDNPNVWVGWISGDLVPSIEKVPIEAFKSGCKSVFEFFLGQRYNITEIDEIIRSNWCTNEHFGGTYSYTATGFHGDLSYQEILATPLNSQDGKPKILFAGEATHSTHYSTVHGAIETGYREAERIINFEKK